MSYLAATRHPWCCLLFLLPLIVLYEGGVFWLSGTEGEVMRNGADVWLRRALESYGVRAVLAAPGLILGLLLFWSFWRWDSRPERPIGTVIGMAIESILLGAILQSISLNFPEILRNSGLHPEVMSIEFNLSQDRIAKIITFVGAGIYEEVLFRLILFGMLGFVLRIAFVPALFALPLAAIISSLLFAAAHQIPFDPEKFDRYLFMLHATHGLIFTLIYWLRGFGIAVGTHAAYDIIVGVRWA